MIIKPINRLQESLLLRKLNLRILHIAPNRKRVLGPAEEVNLVRLLCFRQYLLRLVSFGRGEDFVGFFFSFVFSFSVLHSDFSSGCSGERKA